MTDDTQPRRVRLPHLTVCLLLGCGCAATAAQFQGGTGEVGDPYKVGTAGQLAAIGTDATLLSKHFVLVADIDMSPNRPGGRTFSDAVIAPVWEQEFTGSLDGAGHVIKNLTINDVNELAGLFGQLGAGAVVKDLGIVNATVSALFVNHGVLAGSNAGTILRCYSTGEATNWSRPSAGMYVYPDACLGGLVGVNWGALSGCHSTVSLSSINACNGGLVGINYGDISTSYATGSISTSDKRVGGLIGINQGSVTSCYSSSTVNGWEEVGGLVGENTSSGAVFCSYASGSVAGSTTIGGLVGFDGGIVSSCYSTAKVTGYLAVIGGLVGSIGNCPVTSSYYLSLADGGGRNNGIGTCLSASDMRQQDKFVGFDFSVSKLDGSSDDWHMPSGSPPALVWQTAVTGLQKVPDVRGLPLAEAQSTLQAAGFAVAAEVDMDYDRATRAGSVLHTWPSSYAPAHGEVGVVVSAGRYDWAVNPGNGTETKPYEIQTASQLDSLADHPEIWNRCFVLTADVDMFGRAYSRALLAPDTDDSMEGFQGTTFMGKIQGNGFKIANLNIASDGNDYLGLFGSLGGGAKVEGLDLVDARIQGGRSSDYVGTMGGYSDAAIVDCSVSGSVSGHRGYVGKLSGGGNGIVQRCTVAVSTTSVGR